MMSLNEWREMRKERARSRWEMRHFPPRPPLDETERREQRLLVHEALRQWDLIIEDEPPEQGHASADIEAPRAELGGYHRWLAHTIAAAAAEDYRTLVASLRKDPGRHKIE